MFPETADFGRVIARRVTHGTDSTNPIPPWPTRKGAIMPIVVILTALGTPRVDLGTRVFWCAAMRIAIQGSVVIDKIGYWEVREGFGSK